MLSRDPFICYSNIPASKLSTFITTHHFHRSYIPFCEIEVPIVSSSFLHKKIEEQSRLTGCNIHWTRFQPSASKIMDTNGVNVVKCETLKIRNKPKIVWDNATSMKFMELCLSEVNKGNRPGSHFNKVGWANLEKGMKNETGKDFALKQIKNKWDNLKKDWKLYDRLMRLETGIGGTRSLLDASPEWWEEKIKVDKDFAKFRDTDLSIYETHYASLFRDCVAVGDQTMTPLQFQNKNNLNDVHHEENVEHKGDSDDISKSSDEKTLFPSFPQSSSTKRKKSKDIAKKRSSKSKTSSYEEKLDIVMDAISSRSTQTFPPNNPSPSLSDCMNIVIVFPNFYEGSRSYIQAIRVLTKKQNREAFMFPTSNETKMDVLKALMED